MFKRGEVEPRHEDVRASQGTAPVFLSSALDEVSISFEWSGAPLHQRHNTPIHNILSSAQLSISRQALGTLPEDGNIMPKHVGASIHN
jgi:hypothetical protein